MKKFTDILEFSHNYRYRLFGIGRYFVNNKPILNIPTYLEVTKSREFNSLINDKMKILS